MKTLKYLLVFVLVPLMGCLAGCVTLGENNQKLTFSFANSFSIESTVAKVPDTVARRELKVDKALLEYVFASQDGPPDPTPTP